MFSYVWPIALIVVSNVIYQIAAKSVPSQIHPMASLTLTYTVGALTSLLLYFLMRGKESGSLAAELSKTNWAPFILGVSVVGLEAGFIYAYQNGWQVSMVSIVQSAILTVALIFVGRMLFNEALTWNKIVGILICVVGLIFINAK